ncbi:MAG: PfkB family carbohydrate kinase [Prevotella sp.]|nr:PfkB family carbohydrate kinase [Prevotella sp.]
MHKYDLCCVGHITLDKVVTPKSTVHMPGGTAFYFSHAIRHFNDIDYTLVTSLAQSEMAVVDDLRSKQVDVHVIPSKHSVYFENIYGENQDNRTQRVLAKADPFTVKAFEDIDANIFLLGALLADDFPLELIKSLSEKGLIAVDSQGYLREVRDKDVYPIDWKDKLETLKYVHILKVNDFEMEVLTGIKDIKQASRQLYDWGVKEVLVTLGSLGSIIYDGTQYYKIPAYKPTEVVDATGCGDTYVTGYLYKRAKGAGIEEAGRFAAAMATIKIESSGPFNGTKEDVENRINTAEQIMPEL